MKKITLAALLATVFAGSAFADNTGLSVTANLAFGANGANGGSYYSPTTATIGPGIEFSYSDSANEDTADFSATQLTLVDQVFTNANGWEQTFTTPTGFKSLSLVSSNFAPGITYSLSGGEITVDWLGTSVGPETYTAIFNVGTTAAVPEPTNMALLLAGLGLMGVVARRRQA